MTTDTDSKHTTINLGHRIFHLCPTFEDLTHIEHKLSTSIIGLAKKLSDGIISLEELAVILEHSVEAEARTVDLKGKILETGIVHVTERLTHLFLHLFKGADNKTQNTVPVTAPVTSSETV